MKKNLIFISLFIIFLYSYSWAASWTLPINILGQQINIATNEGELTPVYEGDVFIGIDETGATAPVPMPPEPRYYTAFMKIKDLSQYIYYYKEIRPIDGDRQIWILNIFINDQYADPEKPGFYPVLSWNPNEIPGRMRLVRTQTEDGDILVDDMRQTSSYQTQAADVDADGGYCLSFTLVYYTRYYHDGDHDGYGDPSHFQDTITQPEDYVVDNSDCNDSNGTIHPGANEVCDRQDNNCDTYVDEGLNCWKCGDADGDGQVKMSDALLVAQYVVHLKNASQIQGLLYCNVNGTPGIQMGDALLIARYVVKLVPSLVCQ